mgnify:CR=1 FL=1
MKGWGKWENTAEMVEKGYDALPQEARDYIEFIEKELSVPVDIVSIGPGREDTIVRRNPWLS